MSFYRILISLCLTAALGLTACSKTPDLYTEPEVPHAQLGDNIVPARYAVDMVIDPKAGAMTGVVTIDIAVKQATQQIWIHGKAMDVKDVFILQGEQVIKATYTQIDTIDAPSGLARLNFEHPDFSADSRSRSNNCPQAILPLTSDFDDVRTEIRRLFGTDNTYIPLGLEWGKRVLSRNAPFTEAGNPDDTRRIMIVMTDGRSTVEGLDSPYLDNSEDTETMAAPVADANTATLCTEIKDDTEMFIIAFRVNDTATRNLLRNCATSNANYFQADNNTALIRAFEEIANSLGEKVRLKS